MIKLSDFLDESLKKPSIVNDLRTVKNHEQLSSGPLGRKLATAEWRLMGKGAAGSVFARHGDSYVIKIFDQYDDGYKRWLMFCMNNSSNSFVPKIKGKPIAINKNVGAVRMELLNPIDPNVFYEIKEWWAEYRRHIEALKKQGSAVFKDAAGLMSLEQFRIYLDDDWATSQSTKDFIKCMAFIDNHSKSDLHDGNFMERPNGEVVITDPLYRPSEKRATKYGREVEDFLKSRF